MSTQLDELLDVASGISQGEIPPHHHNECFTSDAFDLLLVNLRDGEAFQVLQDACGRYQSLKAASTEHAWLLFVAIDSRAAVEYNGDA